MTQNPYQGPPQGYPQQPPAGPPPGYPQGPAYDQGQPVGYPPAQPQYAPAPPQGPPPGQWPDGTQRQLPYGQAPDAAPAYGTPPASGGEDGFGDPGAGIGGDGDSPAMHQLLDRLVFIRPIRIEQGKKYKSEETEELIVADMIVLDGAPIEANINGDTNAVTPFATGPKRPPFFIGGMRLRGAPRDKVRDYLAGRGTCLGRIVNRPARGGGNPWRDIAPATEADKAFARQVFPHWDEIKAAAAPPAPPQYGPPAGNVVPPPGYAQAPGQPYPGQPYAQPAPQGPPPGYGAPPQGYPQQPAYPPPY